MKSIELAFSKFFGFEFNDKLGKAIITNINPIYNNLIEKGKIVSKNKGFYENCEIYINNNKYFIVKITPGNAIIDIVRLLKNSIESICLIGIAGSLNEKFQIGDIIVPVNSLYEDDLLEKVNFSYSPYQNGTICQVDGLIKSDSFYEKLKEMHVDFVDMESYYLSKMCSVMNINSKVISIISDKPLTKPFYKIDFNVNFDIDKIISYLD